ncbi:hypothetical protein [Polymorphum gilvum]|uniref:Rhodanese domain-containing protein n=1 Tax=Polymorphum gilvum (strain LMG 25793 / CGMCC 1.9160 / SL003B-26A1) TaxID=991905 RepID=F2IYG7_POLGS|nr:hypothetical protein [Polymorphum gilvum]ADZ68480.1 hypothetical protein SL003B_0041 [Polymorphum gilvum SL003B-26A1]
MRIPGAWALAVAVAAALAAAPVLAQDVGPDPWPEEVAAADFFRLATPATALVVDIRLAGERPALPDLGAVAAEQVPWPTGDSMHEREIARPAFFARLRALAAGNPARRLVLVCGVGARSRAVLDAAAGFGLRGRLSHILGGLEGNRADPGLLAEAAFRVP